MRAFFLLCIVIVLIQISDEISLLVKEIHDYRKPTCEARPHD
jgi:hypothetical protein